MTTKTISSHLGTSYHYYHNTRQYTDSNRPANIDPAQAGRNDTLIDIPVKQAYHELFDDAQKVYNDGQARPERRIDDYYQQVRRSKQHAAVYEMILQVGNRDDTPHGDDGVERDILRDFYGEFVRRNPNMRVIGYYIHGDEDGALHAHMDFIPYSDGYKRGMTRQTGLNRALAQQGYAQARQRERPLIAWERDVNQLLETICNQHGIDVVHPMRDRNAEHLSVQAYKAKAQLDELEREIARLASLKTTKKAGVFTSRGEVQTLLDCIAANRATVNALTDDNARLAAQANQTTEAYDDLQRKLAQVTSDLAALAREYALGDIDTFRRAYRRSRCYAIGLEQYKASTDYTMDATAQQIADQMASYNQPRQHHISR